jgi:hypothetical protein
MVLKRGSPVLRRRREVAIDCCGARFESPRRHLCRGGCFLTVVPPAAAAICTLSVPATISVGTAFSIFGSGFPAVTSVGISVTLAGGTLDEFSVESGARRAPD